MASNRNRGQAALIALLVLTIATTVGLSLMARSTTDISITRNLEESARAFSAAEAGIESVLKTGIATSETLNQQLGTSYNVQVASISASATTPLVFPSETDKEETGTVWLVNHTAIGTVDDSVATYTQPYIDVCWSKATSPEAALLVTVLYKESSDVSGNPYRVVKSVYDPVAGRTQNVTAPLNTTGGCGDGKTDYLGRVTFNTLNPEIAPGSDVLIAVRLRPIYNRVQLAVLPAQDLPYQGFQITSDGQTPSGITRRILVFQSYKAPASIFDAAVVSQNGQFRHE